MGRQLPVEELARITEIDAALLTRVENGSAVPWDALADWMFGALAIALGVSKSSLVLHCANARIDATNDRRYPENSKTHRAGMDARYPGLTRNNRPRGTSPTRRK